MQRLLIVLSFLIVIISISSGQNVSFDRPLDISMDADGVDRDFLNIENTSGLGSSFLRFNLSAGSNFNTAKGHIMVLPGNWSTAGAYQGSVVLTALNGDLIFRANHNNRRIRFLTAGNAIPGDQAMVIDNSGKVGINTDSPKSKLDVNGDIYLSSNASRILMRDPSGGCHVLTVSVINELEVQTVACPL